MPLRIKARSQPRAAAIHGILHPDGRVTLQAGVAAPDAGLPPGPALAARLSELAAGRRSRTLHLSIPRALCLIRKVELPSQALAHAGTLLRLEIEALLPVDPADLLCDWYVEAEDPVQGMLHVRQVVLMRERIGPLTAIVAAAGLRLTRLTVGDAEGRPVPVDLLRAAEPTLRAYLQALPLAAKLLLAGALGLSLWSLALVGARQEATLAALGAARAAVPALDASGRAALAAADFLQAQSASRPLVRILDAIAARLPPTASLQRLRSEGPVLRLTLAGEDLDGVPAALAASPLFGGVTVDFRDAGTLALTLRLTAPGGPSPAGAPAGDAP